jgi:hypothetical protein
MSPQVHARLQLYAKMRRSRKAIRRSNHEIEMEALAFVRGLPEWHGIGNIYEIAWYSSIPFIRTAVSWRGQELFTMTRAASARLARERKLNAR